MSVRWRLALFYALVSVVSAVLLLAVIYLAFRGTQDVVHTRSFSRAGDLPPTAPAPAPGAAGEVPEPERRLLVQVREDAVDDTLDGLLLWSGVALVLAAAGSVGVGWVFAGRVLAPVHTITARARTISADSLDERVSLGGPRDELRELADTFDGLLDRLQDAFESERRLVATMSHELRTPLANQRTALDVALADPGATVDDLRRAAAVALGQADRATRTVDALLTLARVQSGLESARPRPVDLAALVGEAVEQVRAEEGSTRHWYTHLDPVTVAGEPDLLQRAVANLLQNAERHNLPAGEGWVDVRLRARAGAAVLTVASTGARIADPDPAGLVLPFRRGTGDRTGSDRGVGLGLSIVQAVADHHGGRLALRPLAPGGLEVELELPLDDLGTRSAQGR
jgi:signal transduction histidine kinase